MFDATWNGLCLRPWCRPAVVVLRDLYWAIFFMKKIYCNPQCYAAALTQRYIVDYI